MTAGRVLQGTPAAPGRTRGAVFVAAGPSREAAAEGGIEAVRAAAERAAARLEELAGRQRERSPAGADIVEAQAMILRDPALEAAIEELLPAASVTDAVAAATGRFAARLEEVSDPYLRERAQDVREAGRLLAAEMAGAGGSRLAALGRPSVVLAHELSPADTLGVDPGLLLGLATEVGGRTSHTAIVARELGIPAVVGAEGLLDAAAGAQAAEVDGDAGAVRLLADAAAAGRRRTAVRRLPVERAPVRLMANVGSLQAAQAAAARGAGGIGLFRTEFLFLGRSTPPSEEQQVEAYSAACRAMHPHPVTVRTLDAGSDKALGYLRTPGPAEPNPALGRRGIRLWLAHRELWEPQVRALLRAASEHDNLRVMLPMVATGDELSEARALFGAQAHRARLAVPALGMMVELPAAAVAVSAYTGLVRFLSIGTNDLAQYALGADRELEWPEGMSEFHPGVLRLIAACLRDASEMGLEAGVCGELAGVPEGAVFLAGAGATSLSMAAGSLPGVLRTLVRVGLDRCRTAAGEALAARDAAAARRALRRA